MGGKIRVSLADPGFPVGEGMDLAGGGGGGVDSRGGYISKILCVKTKGSGPLGGRAPGICQCRSANGFISEINLDTRSHPVHR